uniref:Plasmid partitioning protein homolog n=1 Tax=Acidithiobacillus ferridurans TaxID=1232575 RepID=P96099_ACIFI|nr:AAA family ATPase [Acidithiobacillus ferridurans]AAC80179.1 plasmid partitioning protein homolog [Acidithiobacillus ferridurans]
MFRIVCNSQKGGSGKSTVCRVLSVHAARLGFSVYLVDTDTQGTLTQWHEARETEEPRRVVVDQRRLGKRHERHLRHRARILFLSTHHRMPSEHLDDVFELADLVLVPIKPTPDDLKAALVTVYRLKSLGVPFLLVITQAIQNTNITAQAIAALSHHGSVAETILVNRVAYPSAFTDGRTPQEIEPRAPAAREIASLWDNILSYLHTGTVETRSEARG